MTTEEGDICAFCGDTSFADPCKFCSRHICPNPYCGYDHRKSDDATRQQQRTEKEKIRQQEIRKALILDVMDAILVLRVRDHMSISDALARERAESVVGKLMENFKVETKETKT